MMEQGMQAAAGETGRLRIGFGFHTLELVPRLVVKLRSDAPGIQITLRDMSTAEQIAALEAGQLDVAFARLPLPGSTDLESLPVIEDRLALILPEKPALPATFQLADCRERPFVAISQERSPGFHSHTLRLCAQHGFHPRIVQEVTEFTTALALVRAGLGLTIMPESFWTNSLPGLQRYRFPEKLAAWTIGATWRRKDTNPALKRFLDLLRLELAREKSDHGNSHRSSAQELEDHALS
jgi:DNA-binding transcriptional LysR family regulator